MTDADLGFAIKLTSNEGWLSIKDDFAELISYYPAGCFIGEVDGKRIGMVTTTEYGAFGFIGNLIVSEVHRGRRYGIELMHHAISYLRNRNISCIQLDAVPAFSKFYSNLGFAKICRSLRFVGNMKGAHSKLIQELKSGDLEKVLAIDKEQFGGDRGVLIKWWISKYPKMCRVMETSGEIVGFIIGHPRGNYMRVGPWIMNDHYSEPEIFLEDLASAAGLSQFKIGVLEHCKHAVRCVLGCGFEQYDFSWRMALGLEGNHGISQGIYSIASPARG